MEPSYEDREGQYENAQGGRTVGFSAADDPFAGDRWTTDEMSEGTSGQKRGERTPEQQAEDLLRQAENLEPDYDFESAEGGNGSPPQESLSRQVEQSGAADLTTRYEYTCGGQGQGLWQDSATQVEGQGDASHVVPPGCTGRESAVDPGWTGGYRLPMSGQTVTGREVVPGRTWSERLPTRGQFSTGVM